MNISSPLSVSLYYYSSLTHHSNPRPCGFKGTKGLLSRRLPSQIALVLSETKRTMKSLQSLQMGHSDRDGAVPAYTATEVKMMTAPKVTYQICVSVESSRRTVDVSC